MVGDHVESYVQLTAVREVLRQAGYDREVGQRGQREKFVKLGRPPITVGHDRGTVKQSEYNRIQVLLADGH